MARPIKSAAEWLRTFKPQKPWFTVAKFPSAEELRSELKSRRKLKKKRNGQA